MANGSPESKAAVRPLESGHLIFENPSCRYGPLAGSLSSKLRGRHEGAEAGLHYFIASFAQCGIADCR